MLVTPKDMTKDLLETAIIYVVDSNFKTNSFSLPLRAKKKVLLCNDKLSYLPSHFHQFDVVHRLNIKFPYEDILALVKSHVTNPELTRITPLSDNDLEPCARLREDLNIPGPKMKETAVFLNKKLQVECMKEHGVRVPKGVFFDKTEFKKNPEAYKAKLINDVDLPMFCKPSIGNSSVGTIKVDSLQKLDEALKVMSQAPSVYIIEEFITGLLFGLDMAIVNDEIKLYSCAHKGHFCTEYFKGLANSAIILPPSDPVYSRMLEYAKSVVKAFSPVHDSWCNLECFLTDKDEIVYCEMNYRRTGSLITPNVLAYTGVNPEEVHISLQTCTPVKLPNDDFKTDSPLYSFYCDYPQIRGTIKRKARLPDGLQSKIEIKWLFSDGEKMDTAGVLYNNCCTVIATNSDWKELNTDFQLMKMWYPYELK